MSDLIDHINDIELKIKTLVLENKRLQEQHLNHQKQIAHMESVIEEAQLRTREVEEQLVAVKTANAMLGSDDFKTKTKLKINALVREIDQCIAQLA